MGGAWEAQTIDFHTFFDVFSMQNLDCNLEGQKIEKKSHKATDFRFLAQGRRWSPGSWGEKKRGVQEPDRELELGIWSLALCDKPGPLVEDDVIMIQHALHTFGGRRIELPPGGATAASPFVCKNVGGLPCI